MIMDHNLMMIWICQGIQDSGETYTPSDSSSTPFSDPDVPNEQIADPGQD